MPVKVSAHVEVEGLDELIKQLVYLGDWKTIDSISYGATFGAAKEVREAARTTAERKTIRRSGALLRGFAIKRIKLSETLKGYTVGVRFGKVKRKPSMKDKAVGPVQQDDPFYWWFLELGTVHIAPRSFLRASFEERRQPSTDLIVNATRGRITRAIARGPKPYHK